MNSRILASSWRSVWGASVLGVLACVATLALSSAAASAASCPNEQLRRESNKNPTTGEPYSTGLPDCRAYEMVSPLQKQAHDALPLSGVGLPVSPDGETAGFASEGDFAGAENYKTNIVPINVYLSRRGATGWTTSSVLAPASLINTSFRDGLDSDFSPDLRSQQIACGTVNSGKGEEAQFATGILCATRKSGGPWEISTPTYAGLRNSHEIGGFQTGYLGASTDMSRVFFQPFYPFVPEDTLIHGESGGIYEIAGVGTGSPKLRLVNVDNENVELAESENRGPLFGDHRDFLPVEGDAYHAVSENGETVFFTATPTGEKQEKIGGSLGEAETVYARVGASKTIAVSNPTAAECSACKVSEAKPATFQGASADGSKVFFTTEQPLLNEDATTNLYEYDFAKPEGEKLVQISADSEVGGAGVVGVLRSSPNGSHIYFVANGVLTSTANADNEKAVQGQPNIFGYDTENKEMKYVGRWVEDKEAGEIAGEEGLGKDTRRHAQITPDGRYLVFTSAAALAGNPAKTLTRSVYRYDFQTGELTWVSHGAPGFKAQCEAEPNAKHEEKTPIEKEKCEREGKPSLVAPLELSLTGSEIDIGDWNRAISEDGSTIIFTSGERLQTDDVNEAPDVYEWNAGSGGTVGMISDGHDHAGVEAAVQRGQAVTGMSATGSDIFFFTRTPLVKQDTDVLGDFYDARVNGGFPAPPPEPSCSGEACQPKSPSPTFGAATSSSSTAGGNLGPALGGVLGVKTVTPKPLTAAQQLSKALKTCNKEAKNKRHACESRARTKYKLTTALAACKAKAKNQRAGCESKARKRYK